MERKVIHGHIMLIHKFLYKELSNCKLFEIILIVIALSFYQTQAVDPLVTETKIVEEEPQVTNYRRKSPDDREFRIAWMAPEKEFHNFSAATSVGALKLGLSKIEKDQYFNRRTVR